MAGSPVADGEGFTQAVGLTRGRGGRIDVRRGAEVVQLPLPADDVRGYDSFPEVLEHDCWLLPEELGGPVVGLDGRALGINVARSHHAAVAVPAAAAREAVGRLRRGAGRALWEEAVRAAAPAVGDGASGGR